MQSTTCRRRREVAKARATLPEAYDVEDEESMDSRLLNYQTVMFDISDLPVQIPFMLSDVDVRDLRLIIRGPPLARKGHWVDRLPSLAHANFTMRPDGPQVVPGPMSPLAEEAFSFSKVMRRTILTISSMSDMQLCTVEGPTADCACNLAGTNE